jgi:hypothetical protein
MATSAELYWEKAEVCRRRAELVRNDLSETSRWRKLAEQWLKMADEAEQGRNALPLIGDVDQLDAEVACIASASLWHCWAVAAHINANLRNISRSLGSLACSAMRMLSCANKSKSSAVSTVGSPV